MATHSKHDRNTFQHYSRLSRRVFDDPDRNFRHPIRDDLKKTSDIGRPLVIVDAQVLLSLNSYLRGTRYLWLIPPNLPKLLVLLHLDIMKYLEPKALPSASICVHITACPIIEDGIVRRCGRTVRII